jgi:anti-sigma factor RsiW
VSECTSYRELLGGYVLDALEPDERDALRRHLEGCPRCRREQAELAGVPALLDLLDTPDAVADAPPLELEEAILDRFARERRRRAPIRPRRRAKAIRLPRLDGWGLRLGFAATVAAVVGVLALAGVFSSSGGESAFAHVRLRGTGGATAEADLRALKAGTGVHLAASGLPTGSGGVYELWCVKDDGRWISGGTFRVDNRGRARVSLTSAARPGEYEVMLVTKRAGGARGPRVLAGRVAY